MNGPAVTLLTKSSRVDSPGDAPSPVPCGAPRVYAVSAGLSEEEVQLLASHAAAGAIRGAILAGHPLLDTLDEHHRHLVVSVMRSMAQQLASARLGSDGGDHG